MSQRAPIKLILTDVDGTILPEGDTTVSSEVIDAFHAAHAAGIECGPATGRNMEGVAPVFAGDATCIQTGLATNGMQIHLDGKLIYEEHVPEAAIEHLAHAVRGLAGGGLVCFKGGQPYLVAGTAESLRKSFPVYADKATRLDTLPDFPVVKVNVFTDNSWEMTREALDYLKREVPELDYNIPRAGFINIVPVGWNKGRAVEVLAQALEISMEQVVVFGDSNNDLEMLAAVPNSVCVSNATPEAASAARWHIGACAEGAVSKAICALARGEFPFSA